MRADNLYLEDILRCIQKIESYTGDGRKSFMDTPMIQDAVARNFEIIGEATKRLSPSFKQAHSEVPWKKVAGLRDVLIHDYGYVDPNEVWGIIDRDLFELKTSIQSLL